MELGQLVDQNFDEQKHPSRGVLRKRCSENIQQIYRRRTTMLTCDFNKGALQKGAVGKSALGTNGLKIYLIRKTFFIYLFPESKTTILTIMLFTCIKKTRQPETLV